MVELLKGPDFLLTSENQRASKRMKTSDEVESKTRQLADFKKLTKMPDESKVIKSLEMPTVTNRLNEDEDDDAILDEDC